MSNLIPIVTPANNTQGIAIGYIPTAIFEKSIEPGSILASTCFIVEIPTHNQTNLDSYIANSSFGDIVQSTVTFERINLLNESIFTGTDDGGDLDSGEKYRTKIYIKPNSPLKPNTTYAALLSKDISLLSVFDSVVGGGNSGDGIITAQGPFKGTIADTYTITIASSGTKNNAKYIWTRASDSFSSVMIEARGRFVEIDRGLKIRFEDGSFTIGDSFAVSVIPQDKQADIFSWTFSSSSGFYQTPTDERSDDLLDIPVSGGPVTSGDGFYVTGINPVNASTMLKIPRKSSVSVGEVVFSTKEYTSAFNATTIAYTSGATAGSEVVSLLGDAISIQIEAGVSTAQQVVTAFNSSLLVNPNFEATLLTTAGVLQIVQAPKKVSKGVDATVIQITFNKDIDALTVPGRVSLTSSPIYPSGPTEALNFSTAVVGKILTLTIEEEE
jgi:hypothetical protein